MSQCGIFLIGIPTGTSDRGSILLPIECGLVSSPLTVRNRLKLMLQDCINGCIAVNQHLLLLLTIRVRVIDEAQLKILGGDLALWYNLSATAPSPSAAVLSHT